MNNYNTNECKKNSSLALTLLVIEFFYFEGWDAEFVVS
jgi:hypothetical protein